MTTHYLHINSAGGLQPHAGPVGADYAITGCGNRPIGDVCRLASRTGILLPVTRPLPVEIPYSALGVGKIVNLYRQCDIDGTAN